MTLNFALHPKGYQLRQYRRISASKAISRKILNYPRKIMSLDFEKSLCLGSGIPFVLLSILISVPNCFVLMSLYRNPLRCFRKAFSVFLAFIAAMDLFVGSVVCTGEAVMRFLCAFGQGDIPKDGDIVIALEYFGINSSILLVTAMSVDRFVSVVFPHFYLRKVKPGKLIICNTAIIVFSFIFAGLQLTGISRDVYLEIDVHMHTTFPLVTTLSAYWGIFFFLRKRARVDLLRQSSGVVNSTLREMRRVSVVKKEQKIAITSFLILIFLIISLIPYFIAILIDGNCLDCRDQLWFLTFKEASIAFLFINSIANPFLTTFRITELKLSVKMTFRRRKRCKTSGVGNCNLQRSFGSIRHNNLVCEQVEN